MLRAEVPWLNIEFFPATDGKADTIPDSEVAQTWNTKKQQQLVSICILTYYRRIGIVCCCV